MHKDGLTKSIWTDADFEVMGSHDAQLHCFTVLPESFEFVMDLDYITKWIHPVPPDKYFSFYVSPATLVFHNAQNLRVTLEMSMLADVEVLEIQRAPVEGGVGWRWTIELDGGEIALDASGYTQYVRQQPLLSSNQHLRSNFAVVFRTIAPPSIDRDHRHSWGAAQPGVAGCTTASFASLCSLYY